MTTLSQPITAVNWYVSTDPDAGDGPDLAHRWGHDDALEGVDAQGSVYFPIASPAWHSYNEGYAVGLVVRKFSAPVAEMDEIEFMAQALDTLRRSTGSRPAVLELVESPLFADGVTPDDMEEWIGAAFSTEPYLW